MHKLLSFLSYSGCCTRRCSKLWVWVWGRDYLVVVWKNVSTSMNLFFLGGGIIIVWLLLPLRHCLMVIANTPFSTTAPEETCTQLSAWPGYAE